jgi:6-phosphofructokinase 1
VACATEALDRLHTTAESHQRVMVLEVMGRYAGWIAIYAGISGGADVILIPEIPFRHERVSEKISERERSGRHFSIVVVAEGARAEGGDYVTGSDQPSDREARLGGVGAHVAEEIERRTGKETRVMVLGHLQRGGPPTNFDRALCTLFGTTAVELIDSRQFGRMVCFTGATIDSVPIADAVGRLRRVPADGAFVRAARALGISLGD